MISARPPHDDPALEASYDATYDVFKGYDLTILENLYNSALNKIVEATETMNPYEIVRSSYATPGRSCN